MPYMIEAPAICNAIPTIQRWLDAEQPDILGVVPYYARMARCIRPTDEHLWCVWHFRYAANILINIFSHEYENSNIFADISYIHDEMGRLLTRLAEIQAAR